MLVTRVCSADGQKLSTGKKNNERKEARFASIRFFFFGRTLTSGWFDILTGCEIGLLS